MIAKGSRFANTYRHIYPPWYTAVLPFPWWSPNARKSTSFAGAGNPQGCLAGRRAHLVSGPLGGPCGQPARTPGSIPLRPTAGNVLNLSQAQMAQGATGLKFSNRYP